MIELVLLRSQACLDVAQTFPVGKLSEGHAAKLIDTGKGFDLVIAMVTLDTTPKCVHRQMLHHLREDETVRVHAQPPTAGHGGQQGGSYQYEFKSATGIKGNICYQIQCVTIKFVLNVGTTVL